jgi:hypothetical protein
MNQQIKALFKFIEFLHSNIQNFNQYDEVISDWVYSANQMNNLNPNKNSTDKLKYDNLEGNFECNLKIIQKNIQEPIHSKATELNICDIDKEDTIWNWNYSEITNLKESFSKEDLPEILEHKKKYIEFRTKTNFNEFLMIFFVTLDTILKELFDYFNETDQNEFEAFEMKGIQVNSFSDAIDRFEPGQTKFTFSNSQSPLLKNKAILTQPIVSETAKYTAKHYVLTYIIECHAKGESLPLGRKKELEQIGNERIGRGKGNRFYKVFNETINQDLNNEEHLIEIGGVDWRNAVIALSSNPKIIEQYLQSKQL